MKTIKFRTKLERWLYSENRTQSSLAAELGYSRQHLHRYVRGVAAPGKKVAARIAAATKGEVTELDLMYPERVALEDLVVCISNGSAHCTASIDSCQPN